ncbi:MAG: hypothetical protein ACREA2_11705 [Blastocatellia bacterium]
MNQPLRIEPVTLETTPPGSRFDLVDSKTDEVIATIYGPDEDKAHLAALIFSSALDMFELLYLIHQRPEAMSCDHWRRDVGEIVSRVREGA